MVIPTPTSVSNYLLTHRVLRQWLFVGLILSLFAGIIGFDLLHEHKATTIEAEERLVSEARLVDDNLSAQLRSANNALNSILRDIPIWHQQSVPEASIVRRLNAMCDIMPGVRTLTVTDATGYVRLSNRPEVMRQNLGSRDYFQRAKQENRADTLYVTPPFKSLMGVYIINLVRVIQNAKGEFSGIVFASMEPDYFKTLLSSVLYAPDMWSGVAHSDGQQFIMVPPRDEMNGVSLHRPGSFFTRHTASAQKANLFRGIAIGSNTERLLAIRTIQPADLHMDKGLVIAISRDERAIYADWERLLRVFISTFTIISLLVIGLQVYYQRNWGRHNALVASARKAQQAAEDRFGTAFSEAPIGMALVDREGNFLQVNRALGEMLGYTNTELMRCNFQQLTHPDDLDSDLKLMHELVAGDRPAYHMEKRYVHRDGHPVWALLSVSIVVDEQGEIEYIIKQIQDITLLKTQAHELEKLAHYDKLTGLPNRTLLADRMQLAIAQAQRTRSALAVGYLDLDGFKPINDTHGHAAGDEVLIIIAERMKKCMRGEETIARLGGDEFVFLLSSAKNSEEYMAATERLRLMIEEPIVLKNGETVSVSASFGLSLYPTDSHDVDALLRMADQAMYYAKHAGGKRSALYSTIATPVHQALSKQA